MSTQETTSETIAVVDDEQALRRLVRLYLENKGYRVREFSNGEDFLSALSTKWATAAILDIGLPGLSGIEVTRAIREWSMLPILIVSVRDNEDSIVEGLNAGADDYLVKPFSLPELGARLRASLRSRESDRASERKQIVVGPLTIDLAARDVSLYGQYLSLTPTEYALLAVLGRNADRVVTHKGLLREVWGVTHHEDSHVVRVTVANLRSKFGKDLGHSLIVNEPRVGYRLVTRENSGAHATRSQGTAVGRFRFGTQAARIEAELSILVTETNKLFMTLYDFSPFSDEEIRAATERSSRGRVLLGLWQDLRPPQDCVTSWQAMMRPFTNLVELLGEVPSLRDVAQDDLLDEVRRMQSVLLSDLGRLNTEKLDR